MPQQPIIFLVPGAWSLPFFYDGLRSSLSDLGLASEAHAHPSIGAEPPTKTLEDDVNHLKNALTKTCDSEKHVIVVAHSYGGLVSSAAVDGLGVAERKAQGKTGGVSLVIFITAFVIPKGLSLIGVSGGQLMPWIKTEGNYAYCRIGSENAFNDLPKHEQEKWNAALTHSSLPVFSGLASYEPWQFLPVAYIIGEEDRMLPLQIQEHMVQMLRTPHVYRIQSSHHPFLSMPDKVASIIKELVLKVDQEGS